MMALGRFLLIWVIIGQGPILPAVCVSWGGLVFFSRLSSLFFVSWRQPDID